MPVGDPDISLKGLITNSTFLNDKVVMLFVELNKANNKNCLPNSCDDKGTTISISIKPLLILKSDADKIKKPIVNYTKKAELAELRMPRHKLASNTIVTDHVVAVYSNILTKAALLSKPIIVSDRFLMGQRVNTYNIGIAVPEKM